MKEHTYKAVFNFKKNGQSYNEWRINFHRFFEALPKCDTACNFASGKAYAYGIDEENRRIIKYLLRDLKNALHFYKEK